MLARHCIGLDAMNNTEILARWTPGPRMRSSRTTPGFGLPETRRRPAALEVPHNGWRVHGWGRGPPSRRYARPKMAKNSFLDGSVGNCGPICGPANYHTHKKLILLNEWRSDGGEGGIRTPGTLARTPHFECGAIDHSATSPGPAATPQNVRRRVGGPLSMSGHRRQGGARAIGGDESEVKRRLRLLPRRYAPPAERTRPLAGQVPGSRRCRPAHVYTRPGGSQCCGRS